MKFNPQPFLLSAFALALAASLAPVAQATRYGDVEVSSIPGENAATNHGYAPYRFRITNDGVAAKRVGIALGGSGFDGIHQLRREVEVPARAGVEVVLHQPAERFYPGRAQISIDGSRMEDAVEVKQLDHGQDRYGSSSAPIGCILTSNRLSTQARDHVSQDMAAVYSASSSGGTAIPVTRLANATASLPVSEWPTEWLSFSRWDAVAITHDEFESMPPGVRAGLTDWVRAGGQLLVLGTGGKPMPREWDGLETQAPEASAARLLGLGRVIFVPTAAAEPAAGMFAGSEAKRGDRPAAQTPDCPPVASGQVPVRGMFMLMLVFAIVVGPANYALCALKNKRIWMLWTSPAIAGVFIAAVFAYALFSDGIRPWGRSAVVTLLDEKAHSAVTLGTTAWYAPMLPSKGLTFGSTTEVRGGGKTGLSSGDRGGLGVEQGATQQLTGGWMVPRYPETFGYRKVEDSRLRMNIEKDAEGTYWAVNGLKVAVDALEVVGKNQRLHCGQLLPGQRVKLSAGPGVPYVNQALALPESDYWRASLSAPLFAEVPLEGAKSHDIAETVIGKMEKALP